MKSLCRSDQGVAKLGIVRDEKSTVVTIDIFQQGRAVNPGFAERAKQTASIGGTDVL